MTIETCKGKHLIKTSLLFSTLIHHHHDGQYGAGREAENSTSESAGSRKRVPLGWLGLLKPQSLPSVTHFLHESHTYFNKATPPNSTTPYETMGDIFIQTTPFPGPHKLVGYHNAKVIHHHFKNPYVYKSQPCLKVQNLF